MSSIKLKGSTSGDITISAPAVAGTNTLTLPAQTGTVPISNVEFVTQRKTATPIIINGDMAIAQRGTSAVTTQFAFPVDRWTIYNSGGTYTAQQQTFTLGNAPDSRLQNYVRITRSSPSGTLFFSQKIEDVMNSNDVTLTVSFYAKANTNITLPVRLSQEFGSGGSTAVTVGSVDSSVTSSWQRFTATFVCPSLSGKTIGTSSYLELAFDTPATYSTLDITAVQIEVGSFDSNSIADFQFEDVGTSLARCQRYYFKTFAQGTTPAQNVSANNLLLAVGTDSGANSHGSIAFPVDMRTGPTVTTFNPFATNASARVPNTPSTDVAPSNLIGTNYSAQFTFNNTTYQSYHIHFTAEAEL